ncbi:MAG TPA: hypothetical protein VER79_03855 [Candidatus Limnocylindrales bacterium]|nr:hypothetical protein [Candidatus Limnocylindrales bacterium]
MSDDPGLPGQVRRVGARDRKQSIEAPTSLIPPDVPEAESVPLLDELEAQNRVRDTQEIPRVPSPAPAGPQPARRPPRKRRRAWPYNLAALGFLGLACTACAWFAAIWSNPYGAFNLFPPLTPLPVVVSMTPTITLTPSPTATLTPEPTVEPSITPTPEPTLPPTPTPPPQPATGAASFAPVETGGRTVVFIANPEARGGCAWQSIAGTVTGVDGAPLNGYQIRVLGDGVDSTAISGDASGYGPGGFEVRVGSEAQEAQYAVQLLDAGGAQVSEAIAVPTSARCDWNISIIRFQQQAAS